MLVLNILYNYNNTQLTQLGYRVTNLNTHSYSYHQGWLTLASYRVLCECLWYDHWSKLQV